MSSDTSSKEKGHENPSFIPVPPSLTATASSVSVVADQKQELQAEETIDFRPVSPDDTEIHPPMFHKPPTRQFVLIIIALSFNVFLASLDQIIVSTSIPAITREYNSLGDISWLGTAYMMTSTAFQPLYGKVSDIFGRKLTMIFANVMFLLGSAVSGWATSMTMLIVGRGVAGVGAGGLMAMVFIILSDMLDMRERGKYLGFIGAVFSLSSVIGPLLGGAFTDHATWRWSFWINLPVGAVSIMFIWLNLDLPWGGSKYAWDSGIIIGLLCAGFLVAAIFIWVEWKVPREPIVPIHLYKIRNLWSTYGSLFFGGMAFFGILFYLPVYFQVVKQQSATVGGLETIPFALGIVITATASGIWVLKRGTFAFIPALGNAFFVVGAVLCVLFERDTPRVATVFILLICGLGMGCSMQVCTLAVQAAVKPKYMATVTAMVSFVRALGQVLGIAIVGSVFNNKLESSLHDHFPLDPTILEATRDYRHIMNYNDVDRDTIYNSFVNALHYVFYCSIAFCVLSFVLSCFIQHKELKTNANQQKPVEMSIEAAPQADGVVSQQHAFSSDQESSSRDYFNGHAAISEEEDSLRAQCNQFLNQPPNTDAPRAEPQLLHTYSTYSSAPENSTWRLWYRTPAKSIERDGFLIGNGRTQVLVGGAINVERLVLNEESCWSGGPGEFKKSKAGSDDEGDGDEKGGHEDEYRGGNVLEEEAVQRQEALQEFRQALKEKQVIKPSTEIVKSLLGDERGFGRPEAVGEVLIEEMRPFEKVERYTRVLDLETGVVKVSFFVGAVEYTREHFCSFPESVCLMRIKSSEPKSVNLKISLRTAHEQHAEYTNVHNRLGLRTRLGSNNMTIETQVAVKTEGSTGVSMANSRQVVALGFDAVTLYYTLGTGWSAGAYPKFEERNPHDGLVSTIDKATAQWFGDQHDKHVKDHKALFETFSLNLGRLENLKSTDELIAAARKDEDDEEESYLDALMVQYGRYLLIASSRTGSLPLSGHSSWFADEKLPQDLPSNGYKMNINLQMNYWLAESTGLGETVTPLIDYMEKLLQPRGEETAKLHYGANGWTTHTYSNIWAHTGPTAQLKSFYFPAAAAWLCHHAWDRYLYSQDYIFCGALMKGASQFWLDSLVQTNGSDDGEGESTGGIFLSSPSYSPEHGPFTEGSALDQQLIWQLFENTLAALAIVGERDKIFVQNLTNTLASLSPGLKIGNWGQLQEWNLDLDDPNEAHRHLGPLWAVYPGTTEDDLGWPKSWRAAVWARLGDGAKAFEALDLFKKHNLKQNNFLSFEEGLSGQLGAGAAVVEMLIQSRAAGSVNVLVCAESGLPNQWLQRGSVQGYRTRDGHNITAVWQDSRVTSVEISAVLKAGPLDVKIGTLKSEEETPTAKIRVTNKSSGKDVLFTRERDTIVLAMVKGATFVIQIEP
ncbi:hypothetical protein BGZ70_001575 [Mortierella alpina]|uniref:Major facilitator superfamily (MFS) profile domain-containing protein n=1 Tax=Mortierella alpina TaxID=64518 RepID=A0A9P6IW22_MORAP|nr:hypothetical protein BGZ70_001575 [Mortierella alpina]